ncbi:hypothetical protein RHMOL_Rhmol02G0298000 [Rhododendron molle]|uniref:Uncharacterized protein n=1 Tax=Rhododendron molle TaxID=49168 RepID=A0ACC0PXE6_RHOML|nr:hypothetical protein RHMOL_Rhmol02G0298000 [Rhododendron molle]
MSGSSHSYCSLGQAVTTGLSRRTAGTWPSMRSSGSYIFFATGGARTQMHVERKALKPHHLCQLGYQPDGRRFSIAMVKISEYGNPGSGQPPLYV